MNAVSFPTPMRARYVDRGLGAALDPQNQNIAATAASAASLTGVLIGALAAIPIAGPIAAAVAAVGVALANVFAGCGNTCVETSDWANQAEPLLQQNVAHYMSAPVHYESLQAAALNNFDLTWNALTQACSNPALGDPGKRCISDRERGACHYHDASGACWNWFTGYRDPIANDPSVVPDPVPGGAEVSSLLSAVGAPATVFGLPTGDVVLGLLALLAASWVISDVS